MQIAAAEALGVAVHTVFIGSTRCPKVLNTLSISTGGLRFSVCGVGLCVTVCRACVRSHTHARADSHARPRIRTRARARIHTTTQAFFDPTREAIRVVDRSKTDLECGTRRAHLSDAVQAANLQACCACFAAVRPGWTPRLRLHKLFCRVCGCVPYVGPQQNVHVSRSARLAALLAALRPALACGRRKQAFPDKVLASPGRPCRGSPPR